jgi:hypothetical protein
MPNSTGKRRIAIVTACMNSNGSPEFVLNEAVVSQEEAENGIHYYLAEADLFLHGYEEPFVHFDQDEAPAFLHPAVRKHLGLPSVVTSLAIPEEQACLV